MKKVISLITSVIILLNTTLAYTLTVRVKGVELTATREPGNIIEVTPKIDDVVGWEVKSGGVTIEDNKFTMPENDVEIEAILKYSLTIYTPYLVRTEEKVEGQSVTVTATSAGNNIFDSWTADGITLSESDRVSTTITFDMPGNDVTLTANYRDYIIENKDVELGAYITYTPSKTTSTVLATDSGYTSDQTYNPSSTTSWRVLKNNNGQLDIISTESIGDLTLEGATGYTKAVYTLNKLCEDYINPTYANSARNPGYVEGSSCETIDTETYPLTWTETYTNGNNGFPYTDELYSTDTTQISTAGVLQISGYIWLASRDLLTDGSDSFFIVRNLLSVGRVYDYPLYYESSDDSVGSDRHWLGVRPIVSLKSGIKITGGEGTADSPFTIGIGNTTEETYTITYDANGGSGAPQSSQSNTIGWPIRLSDVEPSKSGYMFLGWSEYSDAISATYKKGERCTFDEDVTLYAVWGAPLGAYITYQPSETTSTVLATDSGYTSDQTYNPSNTTSWRVLKNNNGQLDIISTESIGDLTLEGATGYTKAVYTLNKLCEDYINPTYANSARNPGYVEGSSCEIIDTETYPLTWTETYTNGNNGFPYTDELYSTDTTQISTAGVLQISGYIWLASRDLLTDGSDSFFIVRNLLSVGRVYDYPLYYESSDDSVGSDRHWLGVRPIVSLKSGIKITGGEGTADSPFTIGIGNTTE